MHKPILHTLHDYFFPHKRNSHRPHIFRTASVAFIVLGVLVLEGAYLTQIKFVFPHTSFLGAVLPSALVALTNDDRTANDVSIVVENTLLAQAAQAAANDMATHGYFAHVSPDGKTPWYWLKLVGYKYQYAGQNLAVDFTDSIAVEKAWMASPDHHANIVKPQYTQIGIGTAHGTYQNKEATFVVQFFASPEIASPQGSVIVASAPKAVVLEKGTATSAVKVLGTQDQVVAVPANPSPIISFFATVSTSPTLTITYILSVLAIVTLALLVIAIMVRARAVYIETIAGGLFLLVVLLGILFFNLKSAAKVQVSQDALASSVILNS
ncbi:MAG: CAP domain-containing protein [Minisyncoccia bacterium]